MEMKKPDPGFKRYGLNSPPKYLRAKLVAKEKANDTRVFVMAKP
jgi:hypothetical protein